LLRTILTASAVVATAVALAAATAVPTVLASPSTGMFPSRGAALAAPAIHSPKHSFNRYYLIEFLSEVGSTVTPVMCANFTSAGSWASPRTFGFSGTYLTSGKDIFASGVFQTSPQAYVSLQGAVNKKGGSGTYTFIDNNGNLYGGGKFTMLREYSSGCS
jgi:hypothetical protein